MIKNLAHTCILARDLEKTLGFYSGLLGLQKKFDFLRRGELIGFYLELNPGQFVEVFQADLAADARHLRLTHFCFEVDDIDAMRQTLIQAGVAVREKKLGADQSWQFWCQDPDGVDVEFHQYTPRSSQLTGQPCEVDW